MNLFGGNNFKAVTVLTAALIAVMLTATPTLAAYAESTHSTHPLVRIKEGTSANWSGYASVSNVASPASKYVTNVQGSWTIPALSCDTTPTYSSIWVGIDGYSDGTVEQIGTEQDCSSGVQKNYVWYEMYPKPGFIITGITVNPGDVMTAKVTWVGNNKFQLSITDTNTGKSFTNTFSAKAQRSSAEWIVEAPWSGHILPLANFDHVDITGATFTDSTGTAYAINGKGDGTYDPITMIDPYGGISTPTGLINSGASSSFSVTFSKSP